MTTEQSLGDIFWDLPAWITYAAGYDLGCSIYVANPTEVSKEYTLMAVLSSNSTVISEWALKVYEHAWFEVDPGDLITLRGSMVIDVTDVDLTVNLIEKESEDIVDSVSTRLISPSALEALPGITPVISTISDMMPWIMLMMMMAMMVSMLGPEKEKKKQIKEKSSSRKSE